MAAGSRPTAEEYDTAQPQRLQASTYHSSDIIGSEDDGTREREGKVVLEIRKTHNLQHMM